MLILEVSGNPNSPLCLVGREGRDAGIRPEKCEPEELCLYSESPGSHGSFGVEDRSDLSQVLVDFLWLQSGEQTVGVRTATAVA